MEWFNRFNEHDELLVKHLNDNGVSYLIVGGAAVAFYGCREVSEIDDLDFLIEPIIANAQRVVRAISESAISVGRPMAMVPEPEWLAAPNKQMTFKFEPFYSEFLTPPNHVDFASMISHAQRAEIGSQRVNMISLVDLIEMKTKAVQDSERAFKKHSKDLACLKQKLSPPAA